MTKTPVVKQYFLGDGMVTLMLQTTTQYVTFCVNYMNTYEKAVLHN